MINVLFTALMLTALPDDTIPPTHEPTDTLKEVQVVAPSSTAGLQDAIRQSMERMGVPRTPNMGEVIDKISPGLTDKILHPFALRTGRRPASTSATRKSLKNSTRLKVLTTWYAKPWNAKALFFLNERKTLTANNPPLT